MEKMKLNCTDIQLYRNSSIENENRMHEKNRILENNKRYSRLHVKKK